MQKTYLSIILKKFIVRTYQVFLTALFFVTSLNAQSDYTWEPVSRTYTTKDGLPSMETYYSIQDSKGYLWVGTDNGVACFNGNKFKSYSINEGLGSNTIYEIREDFRGRVWFFSNRPEIYFFENGEIKAFEHNQAIREYVGDFFEYSTINIYQEGIQLSTSKKGTFIVRYNGEIEDLSNTQHNKSMNLFMFLNVDKSGEKYSPATPYVNGTVTFQFGLNIFDSLYFENFVILDNIFSGWLVDSTYYWATEKRIWLINENYSEIIDFNKEITTVFKYYNELWVAFKSGGVISYKILNGKLAVNRDKYLDGFTVTSGNITSDGSLWLTTLEKGLIQIQNMNISTLSIHDLQRGPWNSVGLSNGYLTGVSREMAYSINLNSGDKLPEINDAQSVVSHPENRFSIVSTRNISIRNKLPKLAYVKIENGELGKIDFLYNWEVYSILELNGGYLFGNRFGVCFSDPEKVPIRVNAGVRTFEFVNDSVLWISNFLWTAKLNINSGELIEPEFKELKQRSTDIVKNSKGNFLFATPGNGIWYLSDTIKNYGIHNGLIDDNITDLICLKDELYWLVSKSNISLVQFEPNAARIILTYSVFDLDCEKIEDASYKNNELYLATNNGIKRIIIDNIISQKLFFRLANFEFNVAGKNAGSLNDYQLDHFDNNITIKYDVISFLGRTVQFRYRLHDEVNWVSTFDRAINLIELPSGEYNFELQSSLDGKNWISIKRLNFSILQPFWSRWWFVSFVVLVFLLAVAFFVRAIVLRVMERNAKLKRLSELQQIALSQQLNPHFVFNAMGSLQNSILKGNIEKANAYIVGFSKFLRSGLDASRAELISLEKEIEMMKGYLNLERDRIGEKLNYNIDYQGNVDTSEILITPFVAQPFIENAIKHGIATKSSGEIVILYKVEEDKLHCSVRDNGVGIESSQFKSMSYGTKIAFERIDLINKLYNRRSSNSIENLVDKNGLVTGVIIQFTLPIIHKNAESNNNR